MLQKISGISVERIVATVPKQCLTLMEYAPDLLTAKTARKMSMVTGFNSLRITPKDMTFTNLALDAALNIISYNTYSEAGSEEAVDIGAIVVVTQTAQYVLPATSHILQERLGLSASTICLDINEGCSGFVTGLYIASLLVKQLGGKKVLLCVGDTVSKLIAPDDRSTKCVFGDAATAALIAPNVATVAEENQFIFQFSSHGDKADKIEMENNHIVNESKHEGYFYMDGTEVMKFTMVEVIERVNAFLAEVKLSKDEIDLWAFHQANKIIVSSLATSLGLSEDKAPFTACEIGNTSSASIPLLLAMLKSRLASVLCIGFGVGLSTGICLLNLSETTFCGVREI